MKNFKETSVEVGMCAITKCVIIMNINGVRYAHQRLRLMVVGGWRDTCCVLRVAWCEKITDCFVPRNVTRIRFQTCLRAAHRRTKI